MKQLRILTGRHAGARLRLIRQRSTVGNGPDADVQIADWRHPPVLLSFEEGTGVVRLSHARPGAASREAVLEDFMPRRFDDIVLCVGPDDDAAWPSDVELLGRLLKRRPQAQQRRPRRGAGGWAVAGAACTVLLASFGGVLTQGGQKAEARAPAAPLQVRVSSALARAGLHELVVREAGRQVTVEGLVATAADVGRVRAVLRGFGPGAVVHRYAAASELAQAFTDALADPLLRVRYAGSGVFTVEGRTADVQGLRESASRIAADLGPLVRRVDVAVTELPPPQRVHVDAMLVAGDLRYVQTRDGTKHLIVSSPEGGDSAMSLSGPSTPQ
jgi:type III secretion protein D